VTSTRRSLVLALAAGALVAALAWPLGGPLLRMVRSRGPRGPSFDEQLLRRQERAITELIDHLGKQPLLPNSGNYAVVVVDQWILQALLDSFVPAEYVIAGRYRVTVRSARLTLEDGFPFVSMEGRASLLGNEDNVYAELRVAGDLEVLRRAPSAEALPARINVLAVEARRVDVIVKNVRSAESLVEDLGRIKLEQWASLAASLQIPVRQQYAFQVPAVGGPVRIAAARVPVSLEVRDVLAFHAKLWVAVATSTGSASAASPSPSAPASAPAHEPPSTVAASDGELQAMRERHRRRHEELEGVLARDSVAAAAATIPDDIVLVMRAAVARDVLGEVADRYLSHVALGFKELVVHKRGDVNKDTFLGRLRFGSWTAEVGIHDLAGELDAGRPSIGFPGGNEVAVELPVRVVSGKAFGALHFSWKAHGLGGVVCRDFEVDETLEGRAIPEEHRLRGKFAVAAGSRALTARPEFDRKVRVRFDLLPASWDVLRVRLAAEDRFTRCGLALDPVALLEKLRDLADRGVVVRLPEKLFRPIVLPTQMAEKVTVAERELQLEMAQTRLRLSPEILWYGADVTLASAAGNAASREGRQASGPVRAASK
jgi:hypothetical protein